MKISKTFSVTHTDEVRLSDNGVDTIGSYVDNQITNACYDEMQRRKYYEQDVANGVKDTLHISERPSSITVEITSEEWDRIYKKYLAVQKASVKKV